MVYTELHQSWGTPIISKSALFLYDISLITHNIKSGNFFQAAEYQIQIFLLQRDVSAPLRESRFLTEMLQRLKS